MPRQLNSPKTFALATVLALALTLLSSLVEREGPELASYGNLCGLSSDQDCLEPVLNAGLPLAYLFDQPGVSVERKLFILQDNIRPLPFIMDFLVYLSVVSLASFIARRSRNKTTRPVAQSDA
jgi:hypothetical protein